MESILHLPTPTTILVWVLLFIVNALLGCHDLALSCCREIAKTSVMEYSL